MGLSTEPRPVSLCATSAPSCSGSSTELCRGIRKFSLARFYPGLFRSAARAGLAGLLRICDGAAKLHSLRVRQLRCDLSAADPCPAGLMVAKANIDVRKVLDEFTQAIDLQA